MKHTIFDEGILGGEANRIYEVWVNRGDGTRDHQYLVEDEKISEMEAQLKEVLDCGGFIKICKR